MKPYSWILCFVALLASSTTTLYAQPAPEDKKPEKPPWEWTLEERIAARYDLERVKVRMAVRNQVLRSQGEVEQAERELATTDTYQVITARDNPELFLPTELFNGFLSDTFRPDRELRLASRKRYAARTSFELDEEFWRDISVIASNVLAKRHREHILMVEARALPPQERAGIEAEKRSLFEDFCGELKQALDEVRVLYGDTFDRFLYETIPPSLTFVERVRPESQDVIRDREQGCQNAR